VFIIYQIAHQSLNNLFKEWKLVYINDIWLHSEKKGGLQNPSKRFCRFLKASKCVQSLKKRIKNSTEPFEGSEDYPLAEPSLTKPFLGFVQQKKVS
jgi:hypothetical protein